MGFTIFEVEIGAGWVALAPMPLEAEDILQIAQWGADFVVSLTEINEGPTATIQSQLSLCGVRWMHVPIVDFGVPDVDVSEALDAVVAKTVVGLLQGRRVLFHCLGGCGRSGMAVMSPVQVNARVGLGGTPSAGLARRSWRASSRPRRMAVMSSPGSTGVANWTTSPTISAG